MPLSHLFSHLGILYAYFLLIFNQKLINQADLCRYEYLCYYLLKCR